MELLAAAGAANGVPRMDAPISNITSLKPPVLDRGFMLRRIWDVGDTFPFSVSYSVRRGQGNNAPQINISALFVVARRCGARSLKPLPKSLERNWRCRQRHGKGIA